MTEQLKNHDIVFSREKDGVHRNPSGLPLRDYLAQRRLKEVRQELADILGNEEYRRIHEDSKRGGDTNK